MAAFDPRLPLEEARTLPSGWYTDPGAWIHERRRVFGSSWLVAGRAQEVAGPGGYLTAEVAGEPLLVVRDEVGTLRAFYNVCRHHAAVVMTEPCGTASRLRCPYHGWTYGLDGRLKGTPDFEGVRGFRKAENGLTEVSVAEGGPWVWVNLSPEPEPVEAVIGPIMEWARRGGLDRLRFAERREYDIACNWKVYVDNYLDGGYHVPVAHKGLSGVLDYAEYRTELHDRSSVQHSPLGGRPDDATAAVRGGDEAAYWWVWPNFMVNAYEGVMDTNLVLPLGHDRCRVAFDFYFAADRDADFRRRSLEVAERVQAEDVQICESVQRGLGSRAYDTGRYSARREAGMYHFHRLLHSRLEPPTANPGEAAP